LKQVYPKKGFLLYLRRRLDQLVKCDFLIHV